MSASGGNNGGEEPFPQGVAGSDPIGHVIANVLEGADLILRHSTELTAAQLTRLASGTTAEEALENRTNVVTLLRNASRRLTEIADCVEEAT